MDATCARKRQTPCPLFGLPGGDEHLLCVTIKLLSHLDSHASTVRSGSTTFSIQIPNFGWRVAPRMHMALRTSFSVTVCFSALYYNFPNSPSSQPWLCTGWCPRLNWRESKESSNQDKYRESPVWDVVPILISAIAGSDEGISSWCSAPRIVFFSTVRGRGQAWTYGWRNSVLTYV